jgi:hypothetical protein
MTTPGRASPPQSGSSPAVTVVELTDPSTASETIDVVGRDVMKPGSQVERSSCSILPFQLWS